MKALLAGALILGACVEPVADDDRLPGPGGKGDDPTETLRIGQFNIRELTTEKLEASPHRQVDAAVELVARFDADILSINEIQFALADPTDGEGPGALAIDGNNAQRLAERVRERNSDVDYAHTAMFLGNSGFAFAGGEGELATRGFGLFEGQYNSALLSKFPIRADEVRVIADYPWSELPGNELAAMEADLGIAVPADFPLFEKALFVVPVELPDGAIIHLVLAHPVSSGFSDLNPYRNRDELRAISLYLAGELPGVEPLPADANVIVIGDLNSDPEDGDGGGGINELLRHPRLAPHYPEGRGGTEGTHPERNTFLSGCGRETGPVVTNPTAKLQLQLDYLLTSTSLPAPTASAIHWPDLATDRAAYDEACFASDHRYVWIELPLP